MIYSFTTFELISYTNDGGEIVIGPKKIKNELADDFRMEDFGEIEEYEVDPRYFEEWVKNVTIEQKKWWANHWNLSL